jgi:riboflavin synthase
VFTGIVTDVGEVLAVTPRGEGLHRLKVACRYPRASLIDGASMACSGVCLTIVGAGEEDGRTWFSVDAAAETLNLTTAGRWQHGSRLNLERPLKMGDELGGHVVAGHVDGMATLVTREELTDSARLTFRAPHELMPLIAVKGSVAIDGVSLTVNTADRDSFSVLIIPHTLAVTTLGQLREGGAANLEVDTLARYAARLAQFR